MSDGTLVTSSACGVARVVLARVGLPDESKEGIAVLFAKRAPGWSGR